MAASMNISLPESLRRYVHKRCAEADYSNPSDYVRALIREDKKRTAQQGLERLILDGLESGAAVEADTEYWDQKRAALQGSDPPQ